MTSTWTFYDGGTGACIGRYSGPHQYLAANTPAGAVVISGHHCHRSTCVDPQTGALQAMVTSQAAQQASAAADARADRDRLLAASDWTDTVSAPARLGAVLHAQWLAYRQALRDITRQPGWPASITWPIRPGSN